MKRILLTQDMVALVDDADFEWVNQFEWCVARRKRRNYAQARVNGKPVLMHNWLLGGRADHIDGDGLNNCRGNIRLGTHKQNSWAFQRKRVGCTSRYRGVNWDKLRGQWRADITVSYKNIALGRFNSEEDAARAFDNAALARDPGFCHLNFPK